MEAATLAGDMTAEFRKKYADAETPLIFGCWYVAAMSEEVREKPVGRWLLGQYFVLFRDEDGSVVALDNRCPHRSFPLSKGRVELGKIICGYHGLTFDRTGTCINVPSLGRAAPHIKIRNLPVVERPPLVWAWLGAEGQADEAAIPAHFPPNGIDRLAVSGYYHLASNYVGLHENLQDLSHFSFLHADTLGTPAFARAKVESKEEDGRVVATRTQPDGDPPPLWASPMGVAGHRVDRTIISRFFSAAAQDAVLTITDREAADPMHAAHHVYTLHFLTPESQESMHYWWFSVRDFALESAATSSMISQAIRKAFLEDKEALDAISDIRRRDQRRHFAEHSFASDRPGMMVRRLLQKAATPEYGPTADGD